MMTTRTQRGFTLIELILAIVLLGIVAAFGATLMMNIASKSAIPYARVTSRAAAQSIVESIQNDYRAQLFKSQDAKEALKKIRETLSSKYGEGYTATSQFIDFDDKGNEIPDSSGTLLKVTVTVGDQTIFFLLTS